MLHDIVEVRPTESHCLYIRFEDNVAGELDIAKLISFEGVFHPLKELQYFRRDTVNPDLGTICWPNGADLDPQVLYAKLTDVGSRT